MEEKEINDYLYNKSLEIEPRGCKQPLKFVSTFLNYIFSKSIMTLLATKMAWIATQVTRYQAQIFQVSPNTIWHKNQLIVVIS